MTENERIKLIVKTLVSYGIGKNQEEIGKLMGFTNKSAFSQVLNGKVAISKDFVDKLCKLDNRISKKWILFEVGNPFIENNKQVYNEDTHKTTKSYVTGRPFYDVDFTLGIEQIDNNISLHPAFNIDFKPANRDGVIWFRGKGDSMLGEINSGDYVALEEVLDFSWFPLGRNYGIVTKNDFRTIKKIVKGSNDDEYILISSNPDKESHPNQPLPKSLIKKLFKVIYIIRDLDE